jgi:hypothetical protein
MAGEFVGHTRFLEAQERHRTANRAAPALPAAAPGEPPAIDGEPVAAPPPPMTESMRSALAAMAKPPRPGSAKRWRVRRPSPDR